MSELLTAHPVVPAEVGGPLLRALGLVEREPADEQLARNFADTDAAGYIERPDMFAARIARLEAAAKAGA